MAPKPKHPIPLGTKTVTVDVGASSSGAVLCIFDMRGTLLQVVECTGITAPMPLPADAWLYTLSAGQANFQ